MSLRDLPSVEKLLNRSSELIAAYGRPLVTEALRETLDRARARLKAANGAASAPTAEDLLGEARAQLVALSAPTLRPVINASGVILHTNLGRAPLSKAAIAAMQAAAQSYSTLEYDLGRGERGSRTVHTERLLTRLTGAEAALVVNNCASALLLVLSALAKGKGVLVARGQLVEIGGGFRVPEVMKQSGCKLIEVGTTNRTHLRDYQEARNAQTALILRAHHSNFKIIGFTTEPSLEELCSLGLPVVDDLGSGALLDTAAYGLAHEPMAQESVAAGAAVITFSGDKLLGGPQAGVILGKAELLAKIKKHPLARAVRADKITLAAMEATLLHYLKDEATREIPIWRMIAMPLDELERRAHRWREALGAGEVIPGESTVGGGSLPGETLPTRLLAFNVKSPNAVAAKLRALPLPIIARVLDGRVVCDPRTVAVEEEAPLLEGLRTVLHGA
ncbi:MAG: L-seryl-tRNA(Sec) selenium transferase [Anaerolineales bacterium]|nr:L-seryl-tRNA(Sec) selenium transferase [Anaerolineales bacterium]